MGEIQVTNLALIGYLIPFSIFLAAGASILTQSVENIFQIGRSVAIGTFLLSVVLGIVVFSSKQMVSPTIGFENVGISLRLDALSVIMCWLVTLLGTFLVQFSHNYLDGDARQIIFFRRLYLTIAAVLLLVLSGNLWQLVIAWIGTSLALHQLLVFYPERLKAIVAARKKFIVARMSDFCLVIAAILIARAFNTSDLGTILSAVSQSLADGVVPAGVGSAAILLVIAATLKSAMFPFHSWLLEVMETPTPVSALLHAGLLNAGTFLIVRFGELVFLSTPALILLIMIGGFTALFASSAMITQSSVKVSLAYSSAAHMGFMLMLCGFGAHSVAIMHLIAHSFYKAHAFLSSGSTIEYVQNTGSQKLNTVPQPMTIVVNLLISSGIFLAIATLPGIHAFKHSGEIALGTIFVMAVAYLLVKGSNGKSSRYMIARTALLAILVTLAFFALELIAKTLLGDVVAVFPKPDLPTLIAMIVAVVAFSSVTLISALLPALVQYPAWKAFYVHLKNGFYVNAFYDRLIHSNH